MKGDRGTDRLYGGMRSRHEPADARANGYRLASYFRREQALVLELLGAKSQTIADLCCGSGLMLQPLKDERAMVFGVDFNADACAGARDNGFRIVRGDAMNLPLADSSVEAIVNCQFFNQQDPARVAQFLAEVRRVLKPGGRAILVWRNGAALIHVVAHAILTLLDRLQGHEVFPQYVHRLASVERLARESGLTPEHRELANPLINWRSENVGGVFGRLMGASCVLVLGRPVE